MAEFIAVILITILAVICPGADFAIVTKNSYLYG
ncbi:LysE family translocator, partial [Acinetobacter baumannii]